METDKKSKKVLRTKINDVFQEALGKLELPPQTKKIKKLIDQSAKKVAAEFADIYRKEEKKKKKAEKFLNEAVNGETKKKKVTKQPKAKKSTKSEPIAI